MIECAVKPIGVDGQNVASTAFNDFHSGSICHGLGSHQGCRSQVGWGLNNGGNLSIFMSAIRGFFVNIEAHVPLLRHEQLPQETLELNLP